MQRVNTSPMSKSLLLPFDGGRWLARNIIHHAVYSVYFVDNAVRDPRQQVMGQARPVSGHEILGRYGPDRRGFLIGPLVTHDAHRTDRQ